MFSQKKVICTLCGFVGKPKKVVKGSLFFEILLWLLFIIPGLIYSIYRLSSKQIVCEKCLNPSIIPIDSPKGQELLKNHPQQKNA